jgi:TolB protein
MKPIVFFLALLPTAAFAQRLHITIDDPSFKPYPIAVADVTDLANAAAARTQAAEMTTTLRADLEFSPLFLPLNPKSFLASQHEPWTTPRFADWVNVGASGLVHAGLVAADGSVTFKFFDVVGQREVLSKTYIVGSGGARHVAHQFADELVKYLTGVDGVFSTRLAFTVHEGKNSNIWMTDFDGSNAKRVTKNGVINLLPSWDRSGRAIFFTSYLQDNPDLYVVDVSTQAAKPISAQRGLNTGASVSPDGKKIALTLSRDGNSEIYVMSRDGTGLKRLTENWWIDTSPSWSPDGTQIAYVSTKTGNPHIYVMNADGSNQHRITFQGNYNQTPDWSPRGTDIAFTARDERFHFDIFTVDVNTHEIKRLTQDQGNNEEPSYSPDGRLVVFTSNRQGEKKVYVMGADGSKQRMVYGSGGECETPAWSPRASE